MLNNKLKLGENFCKFLVPIKSLDIGDTYIWKKRTIECIDKNQDNYSIVILWTHDPKDCILVDEEDYKKEFEDGKQILYTRN